MIEYRPIQCVGYANKVRVLISQIQSANCEDEMFDFFQPLKAAIYTEYMSLSDVHAWADKAVVKFLRPKAWIIELACCESDEKAFDIVLTTDKMDVRGATFDYRGFFLDSNC